MASKLTQEQMELTRKAYMDATILYEEKGKSLNDVNFYLKFTYEEAAAKLGLSAPMLEPTTNSIYITRLDQNA